jgi:uncharacterized protein
MIALEQRTEGVVLPVKAHAGARKNGIAGEHDGQLKVSVTQAPERGKANRAIAEVLCEALALRSQQVVLILGETSPIKQFLIRDVSLEELQAKLNVALVDLK